MTTPDLASPSNGIPGADPLAQPLFESTDEAVAELLMLASKDDSHGAKTLVALADGFDGLDRVTRFVFEALRAFGFCAQGLAADVEAEAAGLVALIDGHPGLAWALEQYRSGVSLIDLNPALAQDPERLIASQARLEQWLGR